MQGMQQEKIQTISSSLGNKRSFVALSATKWGELFIKKCEHIMHHERNEPTAKQFKIDDNNRDLINQLYYYSIGSTKFNGEISKGICLFGEIGIGKTIMLKATTHIINELTIKQIYFILAKRFRGLVIEKGIEAFKEHAKRPMFVDDVGKEETTVDVFGTIYQPYIDLISFRYDEGAWQFETANYNEETLEKKYGKVIQERRQLMMNMIEITKKGFKFKTYTDTNRRS
jgi:DNA replication protein DnaC